MRPILFHVGETYIWSHAVFTALGLLTALGVSWRIARRSGRANQQFLWIVAGGLVGAAIFARYGLVFRYLQEASEPNLVGFLRFGGRSLLGGLAGGYAGVVITKRLIGYRRRTGDILAPGVALGIAIGRVGCFLAERPGTLTTLPWGVRVPPDAAPRIADCPACLSRAAMHPSFLYESLFLALCAWALFGISRRGRAPAPWMVEGDVFKLFLLAYATFRFFVEFVRGSPVMGFGLTGSQLIVLPSAIVLSLYFIRRQRNHVVASLATATS